MGNKLDVLFINPSSGCNLHCRHCWVNEGSCGGEPMAMELWQALFREAAGLGCTYLKLTGGEPFLNEHITEMYRTASMFFQRIAVETNGTLQPEGIWDALCEHPPETVSLSLDSHDEETHDSFRGKKGAWRKTVDFLRKLVQHGIHNQIVMSVTDSSRNAVEQMVSFAERTGNRNLRINLVTPSGRGRSNSFYTNVSTADTIDFFKWVFSSLPDWVSIAAPPALVPLNRLKTIGYCPVKNLMGVLPDGSFSLCGVAFNRESMVWGRYPETSLEEAWNRSPVLRAIRESLPDKLQGVCASCIHRRSCMGRCVVNNLETGGSITSPDILCQRAMDEGLFPATRLISNE